MDLVGEDEILALHAPGHELTVAPDVLGVVADRKTHVQTVEGRLAVAAIPRENAVLNFGEGGQVLELVIRQIRFCF